MKVLSLGLKIILVGFFSAIAASVYTIVAFLVAGHEILAGVFGSDTWAFISHLKLLADYFPNYPFWNYLEGGGVSLIYAYPPLIHTIIIITSKFTTLTLAEAFKFWEFTTVPIFAFGIFLYALVRLKIAVVAFLAGLFYVISPIAWMWAFEWGFVAEHIAAAFAPYIILFFDLFLLRILDWDWSFKTRIYLVVTVVLLGFSLMAHPFIFTGVLVFMIVYSFSLAIFRHQAKFKSLLRVMSSIGAVFIVTVLLFAFWIIPFYDYTTLANNSSTVVDRNTRFSRDESIRNDLDFAQIFSISPPKIIPAKDYFAKNQKLQEGYIHDGDRVLEKGYVWRNLSFPLAVSILFFLGIATSLLFWSKRLPQLFFASFVLILLSVNMYLIYLISIHPRFPFSFVIGWLGAWRGHLLVAKVVVPMAAAFGAYGLLAVFLYRVKFLDRNLIAKWSKNLVLSVFALLLAFAILYQFHHKPALPFAYLAYGKEVLEPARAVYLRNFWREERPGDQCILDKNQEKFICKSEKFNYYFDASRIIHTHQEIGLEKNSQNPFFAAINKDKLTETEINNLIEICQQANISILNQKFCNARRNLLGGLLDELSFEKIRAKIEEFQQKEPDLTEMKKVFTAIPNDSFTRYDTSPHMAKYSMVGPYAKRVPQMTVYINSSSLVHRMWGYQTSNFYADDPVYPDSAALPEIAQWFGIKYMIINENEDPLQKLDQAGFIKIPEYPIYKFEQGEPLISVSSKPKILVIGRRNIRVYEEVFRKAHFGIIPYSKAVIINGGEKIDNYSISELKKFEVLFLHGYSYQSKKRAWELLDEYVREGGRLFIDTGWQFTTPDWNAGKTAEFFPTTTLTWTNFGKTADYKLHGGVINTEGIEILGFEPLIYNNNPWSVSTGDELRAFARPILTVKGNPLVAGGQYSTGRIIWSGMNLLGHIPAFDSKHQEMIFASRLVSWLLEGFPTQNYSMIDGFTAERLSPDRVKFTFKKAIEGPVNLYFKEAYHPKWSAKLSGSQNQEMFIYKAGPGFMSLILPPIKPGDSIEFFIITTTREYLASFLSLVTIGTLILFLVKPGIFKFINLERFKLDRKISSWWESEEE